jgi:hypothetical protein
MKDQFYVMGLIAVFIMAIAASGQTLTNYVIDPGFEEGTAFTEVGLPGWNAIFENSELDDLFPRSGEWAGSLLEFPVDGAYEVAQYHQKVMGLIPGETYLATCFGRLDYYNATTNEWGLFVGVQYFDYEQDLANKVGVNLLGDIYSPVIMEFTMGDTNTTAFIWTWKSYGGEAQSDDWGVWDYHNFLVNAGFEDGTLDNSWDFYRENADVDAAEVNQGSYCGVINEGRGGLFQLLTDLQPNATYGIRAFAKVSAKGDMAWIGVKNHGNDEVSVEVTTTAYNESVLSFTTGSENTSAEVYFWKDAGGPAYVDDYLACMMVPGEGGTSVGSSRIQSPSMQFSLSQNYPNPFNPNTELLFSLPHEEKVKLTVYDATGRVVRQLVYAILPAGTHRVQWDGRNNRGILLPSGVYFYRLEAGIYQETRKLT